MPDFERKCLGNDLVRDIEKGDRPPVTDIFRVASFRYEFYVPFIYDSS